MCCTRTPTGTRRWRRPSTAPGCRTSSGCWARQPSTSARRRRRGVLVPDERVLAHPGSPVRQGPDPRGAGLAGVARPHSGERAPGPRPGDEQGRAAHRAAGSRLRRAQDDRRGRPERAGGRGQGAFPFPLSASTIRAARAWACGCSRRIQAFEDYLAGPGYEPPVDGITLLQEYLVAAQPQVTRVEIVGNEFIYAITADTARGGFQLCPADACAADGQGAAQPSLFALREGFSDPIIDRYLEFAGSHGIGIAGFEFIETADGRLVTYDINTTTNYNADIEAVARRPALPAVGEYLGRLLAGARRN